MTESTSSSLHCIFSAQPTWTQRRRSDFTSGVRRRLDEVVQAPERKRRERAPAARTTRRRRRARRGCGRARIPASSSSASIRSSTSWKASRRPGTTSVTRRMPEEPGRLSRPGPINGATGALDRTSDPRICQRAPAASPRRSGSTPPIPGHQSARWYGSARNAQTSSGEREEDAISCVPWQGTPAPPSMRSSSSLPLLGVELLDPRMGRVARASSRPGSAGRRALRSAAGA